MKKLVLQVWGHPFLIVADLNNLQLGNNLICSADDNKLICFNMFSIEPIFKKFSASPSFKFICLASTWIYLKIYLSFSLLAFDATKKTSAMYVKSYLFNLVIFEGML